MKTSFPSGVWLPIQSSSAAMPPHWTDPLKYQGRFWIVSVSLMKSEKAETHPIEFKDAPLLRVTFTPPSTMQLVFADKEFSLSLELLEMPMDRIRWETAKVAPAGTAMIVTAIKGEQIPIDSSTLRYLVDKTYAARMDAAIKSLQFTRDELEEMADNNPPAPQWFFEDSPDLRLQSWK